MITPEEHMRKLLHHLGEDPLREGLKDTPARWVRAYREMTAGYGLDPKAILSTRFRCESRDMVLLRRAEFSSLCEHHMLPFVGTVSIGYVPEASQVVGLSKLARLIDCFALRLQIQERMTRQIAGALIEHVSPNVAVVVRAVHQCMVTRGVRKNGEMVTSRLSGAFLEPETRAEFMAIA